MPVHDDLGTRMKEYYENIPKTKLMRRTPVAIRIDGKAFHTFTRGFKKPFDEVLIKTMQETTKYLCENIQGCVLGYTQSDEITLILVDYKRLNSSAWFDYEVQKVCSISASMATMAFNKFFKENVDDLIWEYGHSLIPQCIEIQEEIAKYHTTLLQAAEKGAMFDARCFNIPREEVTNLVYWRQLDAARNSVQMVGQAYFSQNELHEKTCSNIQDMLMEKYKINWNDYPTYQKRGTCVVKNEIILEKRKNGAVLATQRDFSQPTHAWIIDKDIPQFKGEGREYIEKLIRIIEEA